MADPNSLPTLRATIEHQAELKHCSNCGRRFGCGMGDNDCWCAEIPHLPSKMITSGKDCMCPDCLQQLTNPEAPENSA